MGIDLRKHMHVAVRRSGARGIVLRYWRHANGHVWAEVRFVNGDMATVRSTHLERITLAEDEVEEVTNMTAGSLTNPLELMQRTIDRSLKITSDCGANLANAFDEVLKADGSCLLMEELRAERGQTVPESEVQVDEDKARRKAALAREGRTLTRSQQLVVRYAGEDEPGVAVVACTICKRRGAAKHEWRIAVDASGVLDGGVLHKIRSHCGQFASVRHAATLEHCVALGRLTGRCFSQRASDAARLPPSRARSFRPPVQPKRKAPVVHQRPAKRARPSKRAIAAALVARTAPRLQIHNGAKFVDLKRDAGRSVRYHRLARRLQTLLRKSDHGIGKSYAPSSTLRATSDKCLELARVLLRRGLVDKVPVAKAADVRALKDAKDALEANAELRDVPVTATMDTEAHALALDETRVRRTERMALLFVAHQLWTPARIMRFARAVCADADDDLVRDGACAHAAAEDADSLLAWRAADGAVRAEDCERLKTWRASLQPCPVRLAGPSFETPVPRPALPLNKAWNAPSKAANRCRRALVCVELDRDEARHREAALENDVFTGRHRTRTTPQAALSAGWTRRWSCAQKVAEVFVEVFDTARANDNTINDEACVMLVRTARQLPDVGAYIGAHLVRSLLAVHGLTLPLDAWGAFTMADDSVGQMRELLGDDVCATPMQLRVALAQELGSLEVDAGDLALILCETHSCWALAARHAQHHAPWAHDALLQALRDTPAGWAGQVREALLDEYHLPYSSETVYHPAHKLLLVTMVAKGLHDVNVLRMAPPSTFPPRPLYRVWAPGDEAPHAAAAAREQEEPEPPLAPPPPPPTPSAFQVTPEELPPIPPVPRLNPTLAFGHYSAELRAGPRSEAPLEVFSI